MLSVLAVLERRNSPPRLIGDEVSSASDDAPAHVCDVLTCRILVFPLLPATMFSARTSSFVTTTT